MPTTIPTILDQISVEKTKVSERLARLDADREKIAIHLTDLETAERVLTRVGTPSARKPRLASAAKGKTLLAKQRRGRPSRVATSNPVERRAGARTPSLGEVSSPWRPAKPDGNYTQHVLAIARTMSASQSSATCARVGSRSATASCTRHRGQHSGRTRQPGLGTRRRPRACSTRARETSTRGERLRQACAAWPGRGQRGPGPPRPQSVPATRFSRPRIAA